MYILELIFIVRHPVGLPDLCGMRKPSLTHGRADDGGEGEMVKGWLGWVSVETFLVVVCSILYGERERVITQRKLRQTHKFDCRCKGRSRLFLGGNTLHCKKFLLRWNNLIASSNEGRKIPGVLHVIYCTEAIWKATRNGRRRQTVQDPPGDREIRANIRKCLSVWRSSRPRKQRIAPSRLNA